jgi:UDP-N-acetylmuramate--alanine ligase
MSRSVHLVGIGGAGMSAIAKVLHGRGEHVTGSDRTASPYSTALEALGIEVTYRHAEENLGNPNLVVASSAIPEENIELVAARGRGIPVLRRNEFLPDLTAGYDTIAIAGTHGKTTTTGLVAWLMIQANLDPSFMVGGILCDLETNARMGKSAYFVIEADEYDRAFLGLSPKIAVITNVEHDHPDCYPTEDDFRDAFIQFGERVEDTLIVSYDDPGAADLPSEAKNRITYGLDPNADWHGDEVRPNSAGGSDFLIVHDGETLGLARTRLPGLHNVRNVLGAVAVLSSIGVTFRDVREALTEYQGVERRFQILGTEGGVTVIDDYAHHPTEIKATLRAARERYPNADIWAVFQPHTYSRLRTLEQGFTQSFGDANHIVVTEVFAAREQLDPAHTGREIAQKIDHPDVRFTPEIDQAAMTLHKEVRAGAVVITLSAGDGNQVGVLLLEKIKGNEGEKDHG